MRNARPRRAIPPDEKGTVAAYMATQRLKRRIIKELGDQKEQEKFWQLPHFARIRAKEPDRLTLDNVLLHIDHHRKLKQLFQLFDRMESGHISLARFIKTLITPRPQRALKPDNL